MNDFFVGIDLGGTRVKTGIVQEEKVIGHSIAAARSADGLAGYLPELQLQVNQLINGLQLKATDLKGVGISFPGLVDTKTKRIVHTNRKYDDAPLLHLDRWVFDTWGVPCMVDNDARMAAAGEWKYGAGKGSDNIVMVTIGTGIGSAAIIEGKLLRGKHFQAGVLGGHLSIQYEGAQCICGNTGCAELYGGSWNLAKRITQHPLFESSVLKNTSHDFFTVFDCAKKNDALALQIMRQSMNAWAAAISNLVLAYDPELVILGGGVLASADIILPFIEEKMKQQAWSPWGTVAVKTSILQEDAAIMGVVHCLQETN